MDPDETARMRRLIWIHAGRNRLKHSMVYFFHHYELPAILQQARVQQLLNRNGNANITVTTGQLRSTPNNTRPTTTENGGNTNETNSQQPNIANGHIITEENNVDDGDHHILQNNVDQGLLNEIFEGVEDVHVGGFNIDQQLLHHLEEEIQELQFSHNQAVSNTENLNVPVSNTENLNVPVSNTENLNVPSASQETSVYTDTSTTNASHRSDSSTNQTRSESNSSENNVLVSADLPSQDCDTSGSGESACVGVKSVTQSQTCDTQSDSKNLNLENKTSDDVPLNGSNSQSAIGNDNHSGINNGANLRFRGSANGAGGLPPESGDHGTEV